MPMERSAPAAAGTRAPSRPTVSGIVACRDEETNIEACLESLAWCDEIIVVDSFSTDRTPELARRNPKVRFFQRSYYGDGSQRNWAINAATSNWVLVLDADERCSPALRAEIEMVLGAGPTADAYTIPRRTFVLGAQLRYSGWQNDRVVRLVRRGAGYYSNLRVHARMVTAGPAPRLREALDHHMIECFHHYVRRINQYGFWGAAQAWRDQVRPTISQIAFRPGWRFVRTYILQLGFLDGMRGLTFCALQAYATYLKWSLLWSWHLNAARGIAPALPEFDDDPAVWSGLERVQTRRRAAHPKWSGAGGAAARPARFSAD
jgi:glycosyltransferase involved in cell wall biosynthesis